ncbi:TauD/TfdA family dioxygenase [Catenulispora pinistramenti]|uniref:TauD/TfdA family dioxygenase n=1 Tax=Catenulispora pinistramenti TaxID=2705254 RepID=UPI001E4EF043
MDRPDLGEQERGQAVGLPYIVQGGGENLADRLADDRAAIRDRLRTDGAVLLRGFDVGGTDGFAEAVRALSGELLPYEERSSPRETIKGRVYSSTEYPPHEEIFFHNENSYQQSWPMTLYFHCVQPPAAHGATPLVDTRRVLAAIDPAVVQEFSRRRWMAVRNFHPDFGLPWQEVFGVADRAEVLKLCGDRDIDAEWCSSDQLRTTSIRDAVHVHPDTGEPVWFNHIAVFHMSTLSADLRDGLRELFPEPDLPANSYYGDGGVIPDDVLAHVRDCYRSAATRFDYRRDDVLVIDNMLTAHGREPFSPPRRVAVAMAEPTDAGARP